MPEVYSFYGEGRAQRATALTWEQPMPLKALCFFACILLACCSAPDSATISGAERAAIEATIEHGSPCDPPVAGSRFQRCNLYIVLTNQRMARLSELRYGVPYVEPRWGADPVRYANWLAELRRTGVDVAGYIGGSDPDFELKGYLYIDQYNTT